MYALKLAFSVGLVAAEVAAGGQSQHRAANLREYYSSWCAVSRGTLISVASNATFQSIVSTAGVSASDASTSALAATTAVQTSTTPVTDTTSSNTDGVFTAVSGTSTSTRFTISSTFSGSESVSHFSTFEASDASTFTTSSSATSTSNAGNMRSCASTSDCISRYGDCSGPGLTCFCDSGVCLGPLNTFSLRAINSVNSEVDALPIYVPTNASLYDSGEPREVKRAVPTGPLLVPTLGASNWPSMIGSFATTPGTNRLVLAGTDFYLSVVQVIADNDTLTRSGISFQRRISKEILVCTPPTQTSAITCQTNGSRPTNEFRYSRRDLISNREMPLYHFPSSLARDPYVPLELVAVTIPDSPESTSSTAKISTDTTLTGTTLITTKTRGKETETTTSQTTSTVAVMETSNLTLVLSITSTSGIASETTTMNKVTSRTETEITAMTGARTTVSGIETTASLKTLADGTSETSSSSASTEEETRSSATSTPFKGEFSSSTTSASSSSNYISSSSTSATLSQGSSSLITPTTSTSTATTTTTTRGTSTSTSSQCTLVTPPASSPTLCNIRGERNSSAKYVPAAYGPFDANQCGTLCFNTAGCKSFVVNFAGGETPDDDLCRLLDRPLVSTGVRAKNTSEYYFYDLGCFSCNGASNTITSTPTTTTSSGSATTTSSTTASPLSTFVLKGANSIRTDVNGLVVYVQNTESSRVYMGDPGTANAVIARFTLDPDTNRLKLADSELNPFVPFDLTITITKEEYGSALGELLTCVPPTEGDELLCRTDGPTPTDEFRVLLLDDAPASEISHFPAEEGYESYVPVDLIAVSE